jgi:hypothetical protein
MFAQTCPERDPVAHQLARTVQRHPFWDRHPHTGIGTSGKSGPRIGSQLRPGPCGRISEPPSPRTSSPGPSSPAIVFTKSPGRRSPARRRALPCASAVCVPGHWLARKRGLAAASPIVGNCSYVAGVGCRCSTVGIEPGIKVPRVVNDASPELQILGAAPEDPALRKCAGADPEIFGGLRCIEFAVVRRMHGCLSRSAKKRRGSGRFRQVIGRHRPAMARLLAGNCDAGF